MVKVVDWVPKGPGFQLHLQQRFIFLPGCTQPTCGQYIDITCSKKCMFSITLLVCLSNCSYDSIGISSKAVGAIVLCSTQALVPRQRSGL